MYKILISGYYGFNNIGDESILQAVVSNLSEKLDDIEITVLSKDPASTIEKYGVKAVDRKSLQSIIGAIKHTDLLISGGGSLLQDVTSKKSIIYYLLIMWIARFFRKKVFIYSQGIGPINSAFNRMITARTLKKAAGIVVRDGASKEFLEEIGVPQERVVVTADPVLRISPADLNVGREILEAEGCLLDKEKITVGFAIREKKPSESEFVDELTAAIDTLCSEHNAQVVLIPFHHSEDMAVIEELEKRLEEKVVAIKHKYLTNEMLSIIGNMDYLVGARLHALIHAAIMNIPMIAISYDPKINSFMKSIGMKAMCSIYDFNREYFLEEYVKTCQHKDQIQEKVREKIETLIESLDTNEEMIRHIMDGDKHGKK